MSVKKGKDAMSVELYTKLCGWNLNWGTIDGVFCHSFLVLSWNLACRSNNTGDVYLYDINWVTYYDTFDIFFAHTKTDQTGNNVKYPRYLFANPMNPLICPVFALSVYFSCCCNSPLDIRLPLFPGSDQHSRFRDALGACLRENEEEVNTLGFSVWDIGTYSIRKGAVSYLAFLVGRPLMASMCIRAGWMMGRVRDIYMHYIASGDQYVGRSLCLLPILSIKFGASPPFFVAERVVWGAQLASAQMPMVASISHC